MRSDLNKQLCERERVGHKKSYKEYRKLKKFNVVGEEGESLSSREGMKFRYGWDKKSFNENLNPLWGAVRKAVGKPWDKFYSELCQNFDKRSVINQHILLHLEWHVERKDIVVGEDGELYVKNAYGPNKPLKGSTVEYFVDPRDGILKLNKARMTYKQRNALDAEKRKAEEEKVFRQIDKENVLRFVDGVWYHFTMKPVPVGRLVFVKPYGVDSFKPCSWRPNLVKTWDELTPTEKEKYGQKRIEGGVKDVFTGNTVVFTGTVTRVASEPFRKANSTATKVWNGQQYYHAEKKTASHKILKKAGLV